MDTNIIILVLACLGLGVVLDNLARLLLKKETPPEPAPPAPVEPLPETSNAAAAAPNPAGLEEVVRLWDEAGSHVLLVEMNGQPHHLAQELSSEQRSQLESVLERLSNWLGKPLPTPAPRLVEKPDADNLVAANPPDAPVISEGLVVPTHDIPQRVKKPSLNPLDVIVNAFQADVAKPDTAKSLAEQVDEVLQEKLAESPLRGKGIRLLDLPGKGLMVMVGLEKYDGVDAVPDEEVRAILRAAVDEWGRRTGGRKA